MTWTTIGKRLHSVGGGMSHSVSGNRVSFDHSRLNCHIKHTASPSGSYVHAKAAASVVSSHQYVPASVRGMSSPSEARVKKQALDRDVIVSVLEAAATKRDARGYLQKYTLKQKTKAAPVPQDQPSIITEEKAAEPINVAIVTVRDPQHLDQTTLDGIGKTLAQLRVLGLLSIVVVDCSAQERRDVFKNQALRLCESIDSFAKPGAKLACDVFFDHQKKNIHPASAASAGIHIADRGLLEKSLQHGLITVIPCLSSQDEISAPKPANVHRAVLALTKYCMGLQLSSASSDLETDNASHNYPRKIASVERIILLDSLGGTPVPSRPGACHRFINLEQEYDTLVKHLLDMGASSTDGGHNTINNSHAENLSLVRDTLSILPPTSSAVITTPLAAANTSPTASVSTTAEGEKSGLGFNSMVTTRSRQNPLLHNLLTDKPVFSSSLPFQRTLQNGDVSPLLAGDSHAATLVKKGMPVTIYPDPRKHPWQPGGERLRLTDNCIDLPRLVHLIEDSFNRKLDVQDYLNRVNDNLAGIIIAGEYEGGAILTWESPDGVGDNCTGDPSRQVPYLDKFAVLKSRQGSGGVADVLFNAMVRDCFPNGVCWRSRKDNPVNKWYFERSLGSNKLSNSNWTMFWTTPELHTQHLTLRDYETVCRNVQPSWADNKHILD